MKYWSIITLAILLLLLIGVVASQPYPPAHHQLTLAAMNLIDTICAVDQFSVATVSFFSLLSAGLLTGVSHCLGMCGPLVGAFAARRRAAKQELSTSLALFQSGRLTMYLIIGALAGSLGQSLTVVAREWQIFFSMILGLLIILAGLGLGGLLPVQRWLAWFKLAHLVSYWLKRLITSSHPAAPFGLGLANGLLPCGAVYLMSLAAVAAGGPLKGSAVMFIFGLGTLPAMLGFGFSAWLLGGHFRANLYRLAAALMIIIGLQLTLRGLALGGQLSHAAIGGIMVW